jgi:hypothetical protein
MTKEDLQSLGEKAAQQYLQRGVSLNDSISKMSEMNKLNQHQVGRVVEFANNATRAKLYQDPNVDQAALVFPTADASTILKSIKPEDPMEIPQDYMASPRVNKSINKAASVSRINMSQFNKEAAIRAFNKAGTAYSEAYDNNVMKEIALDNAIDKFIGTAVNYLRENHDPEGIVKVAMTINAPLFQCIYPLLKKAAPNDVKRDLITMSELMNPDIKATYIQVDHPLVITYKGYATASEEVQRTARDLESRDIYRHALKGYIEQEKFAAGEGLPTPEGAADAAKGVAKEPGFFSKVMPWVGPVFGAGETYMGYSKDVDMFKDQRDTARSPEKANARIEQAMQKYPDVFKKVYNRLQLDWDNTPEDRMLATRNRPKIKDDRANFGDVVNEQAGREGYMNAMNRYKESENA